MPNLGSFGNGQGNMSAELQEAIKRRPAQTLNQAPGAMPAPPPQPGQTPSPAAGAAPQGQEKPIVTEAEMILKALDGRLKSISKVDQARQGIQ